MDSLLIWVKKSDSFRIYLKGMKETVQGVGFNLDCKDFNIDLKVAWVKGLNRFFI